jgi:hypothetical protein
VGICLFVEIVVAAKPSRMIPRLRPLRKIVNPLGIGTVRSYSAAWL